MTVEHPLARLARENSYVADRNRRGFHRIIAVLFLLVLAAVAVDWFS